MFVCVFNDILEMTCRLFFHVSRKEVSSFEQEGSVLLQRVRRLEAANMRLKTELQTLETEKLNLLKLVHQHGRDCKDIGVTSRVHHALTRDYTKWPA